ncbi:MAG: SMI1/KNR4 family protein [Leptolyngbya sp. BL-A-14]
MSSFDWERFLRRWSQEIINSIGNTPHTLPPEILQSGWLGYAGATEQQIARAEARLQTTLPPSYRAFLKVTNGWRQTPLFSNKLWSIEEIEWFAVKHQAWIDAFWEKADQHPSEASNAKAPSPSIPDAEYFVYGDDQDCSKIRVEYLQTALEISQRGDGVIYLLNPQIVTPEGEWEAWFFGDWLPGADRYQSFQDMIQAEYENFLELREVPAPVVTPIIKSEPDINTRASVVIEADAALNVVAPELDALPIKASEPSATVASKPSAPMAMDGWHDLASFTIEFQTRQVQSYRAWRTSIHHQETNATETRFDMDTAALQQWMRQQWKGTTQASSITESVGLEITQLRVLRSPHTKHPMVANQTEPLFSDTLQSGEPFGLEVSMNVVGATDPKLAEQQLVCRAQCIAHHLSTQLDTHLGDITTHLWGGTQTTYTAQFPEMRLQQPGLYRLKVWVTLQNIAASPGYFKVPMLQVV